MEVLADLVPKDEDSLTGDHNHGESHDNPHNHHHNHHHDCHHHNKLKHRRIVRSEEEEEDQKEDEKSQPKQTSDHRHRSRYDSTGSGSQLDSDPDSDQDTRSMPSQALDKAEEIARKVWDAGWTVVHHHHLPGWLMDNDFLVKGHRPPLPSFSACARSIFRIHTETGNIWTHLLGFLAFVFVAVCFLTRPSFEIQWQEKLVFSALFLGAICCMGFSWVFHTFYCHSEPWGKFFSKLDYCGIAIQIMGSFVPWVYYSFYCRLQPKIIYSIIMLVLGTICIIVSMWDTFAQPEFRTVRAASS